MYSWARIVAAASLILPESDQAAKQQVQQEDHGQPCMEYLEGNSPFTVACDVFSYAMVLFEVSSDPPGAAPFEGQSGKTVRALYLERKRPLMHAGVDGELAQLIHQCWDQDPSWRPTFSAIVRELQKTGKAAKKFSV
jgi:hypothetical protein